MAYTAVTMTTVRAKAEKEAAQKAAEAQAQAEQGNDKAEPKKAAKAK